MAAYKIFFRSSVMKDLKKIPKNVLRKILKKIEQLGENPRPYGCEKLTSRDRYRIRHRNYSIVYSIQDDELTVWVVKVGHRKDSYR